MRILHVEHPDGGGPGVFADIAALETWRAWEAPPPAGDVDAIVLYGGATDVADADREPWLRDELAWLAQQLEAGVPALGLCLGGQLIAAALGAEVRRSEPPEIGWHDVALTPDGLADPVLAAMAGPESQFPAFQWHSWTFGVPAGASLLATSAVCVQAFRHGRAWGVQFHPEVDRPTLERWIAGWDQDPSAVALGFDPEAQRAALDRHLAPWQERGRRLFAAFLHEI